MKDPSELPVETQTQLLVEIQKVIWPPGDMRPLSSVAADRDLARYDCIVALLYTVGLAPE